jgi:hypothetical protein
MPLTAWPNFALILVAVRKAQYEMGLYNFFMAVMETKQNLLTLIF